MSDKKVVIALGFFDSVHKGHKAVINTAIKKAKEIDATSVVFAFGKDLRAFFGLDNGVVFTSEERKSIFKSLGVDLVYFAPVSKNFLDKGKLAFLNFLNKKYNISAYVCGEDYTFGINGGNLDYLKKYATQNQQEVILVDSVFDGDKKISSTDIKNYLADGEVEKANNLLFTDYFITGKVFQDRKIGRKLGFPTVNVKIPKEKTKLKCAVYSGYLYLNGKKYLAIINYGARPTFDLNERLIEAHIIGYKGNLYGKNLQIYFSKFMREIEKFKSQDELVERIKKDIVRVEND